MPPAPTPTGLGWLGVVGPGRHRPRRVDRQRRVPARPGGVRQARVVAAVGDGVAVVLQTIFNNEVMRYTLATGEPVFTGFMRTRPSSTLWAWIYVGLYFLQVGWPALAATAAGAIFFLFTRRLPLAADADHDLFHWCRRRSSRVRRSCSSGAGSSARSKCSTGCWWSCILGELSRAFAGRSCPLHTWLAGAVGLGGFDLDARPFDFFPPAMPTSFCLARWWRIRALAA